MANPLKILTVLTASQAAKFQQGLDANSQKLTNVASGSEAADAVNYGQLTSVSGAIKSYVDAADTVLSGAIVAEQTRALAAEGVLSGAIAAETSRALAAEGVLSGAIVAEASARAAEDLTFLKLDGSRSMTGALNMGGFDITSAKSGSFSGDVTVGGNLQVNGQLTYVNSTELQVTDKLITLAKGAVNPAAAAGGGIELEGANAKLVYDNDMVSWSFNKNLNVSDDTGVSNVYLSGNAALTYDDSGNSILVVGDGFETASLASPVVAIPNTLQLSGTAFAYITTPVVNDSYNVNSAIRALDLAVSGAVNAGGNFKSDYNAHRHVATGSLSSGQAVLNLTTLGGAEFAAAEISKIALDVMIDADSTGYTNDLVAIKMYVDGADVKVQIDAPATPEAAYRLIAVNEEDIA